MTEETLALPMAARAAGWRAVWSGGMYIDIYTPGRRAVEVINIRNYEITDSDDPHYYNAPESEEELKALLKQWLEENQDDLHNYLA